MKIPQFALMPRHMLFGRVVLIYQMPKIGSQTIEATLRHWGFAHPVRRLHFLAPTFAKTVRQGVASDRPNPSWKHEARKQLQDGAQISRALRLRRLLALVGLKLPKLEIITGVRELIGLVLAAIFENYLYFSPNLETMTVDRCRDALLHPKTFKALRQWFDLELKPFVGIDVFKTPFPHEQGYLTLENRFARVLLYRFEILGELASVLGGFLRHEIPSLVNINLAADKSYAQQYGFVRENLRLPAAFVRSLYEDKLMQHFYSPQERQCMHRKWSDASRPLDKREQSTAQPLVSRRPLHWFSPSGATNPGVRESLP